MDGEVARIEFGAVRCGAVRARSILLGRGGRGSGRQPAGQREEEKRRGGTRPAYVMEMEVEMEMG